MRTALIFLVILLKMILLTTYQRAIEFQKNICIYKGNHFTQLFRLLLYLNGQCPLGFVAFCRFVLSLLRSQGAQGEFSCTFRWTRSVATNEDLESLSRCCCCSYNSATQTNTGGELRQEWGGARWVKNLLIWMRKN